MFIFSGFCFFAACTKETNSFRPKRKKLKIVSLTPAASSILSDLGYQKNIIGRCSEDFIVPQKKQLGSILFFSLEKILALKPTVIVYQKFQELRLKPLFGKKNIRFISISPKNFKSIIKSVEALKKQLSVYQNPSLRKFKEFKKMIAQKKFIQEFHFVAVVDRDFSFKQFFVAGKTSYVSEILALLGGINLFSQNRAYFQVGAEEIMRYKNGFLFDFSTLKSDRKKVFSLNRLSSSEKFLTIPDLRVKEKVNFLQSRLKGF